MGETGNMDKPIARRCWIVLIAAAVTEFGWFADARAAGDFDFHHENVMGTSLELRVRADDSEAARQAEGRILGEIDRLSAIFSGYDPGSEFSRWQAKPLGPVEVSRELFEMLDASDQWRERTGGAFDPRAQAFSRLWSRLADRDRIPTTAESKELVALTRAPAWRLDYDSRTAERLGECPIGLNAIAKGFIVERACAVALDPGRGVRGLALNVGGDLRVCGDLSQSVGIAAPSADSESSEPLARIEVRDRAVATSGSSQRGLWIGGKWYSHIFDPRSGTPAGRIASATVIAERSADADALATAFNVLDPEASIRLAESLPEVDSLIVTAEGTTFRSKGWSRYESSEARRGSPDPAETGDRRSPRGNRPPPNRHEPKIQAIPSPVALARSLEPKGAGAGKTEESKPEAKPVPKNWGDTFELVIDFEINRPDMPGSRYRRPYVAVWVEDKDGFPVRNLILWLSQGGAGPFQWVPDLKRWYASDKIRKKLDKKDMVLTISRPTRPPGKYSAIWNGKDDKGRPLPPGEYTISIDAAREHGTYQGMRQKVTIGEKPFSETLEGGTEVKSAGITYRRKKKAD
jgi:thiamine biosynthesis lipoprotein ApbE